MLGWLLVQLIRSLKLDEHKRIEKVAGPRA